MMTTAVPPAPAGALPYDDAEMPMALVQARTRRFVLRIIWTSTAFLVVSGILGLLLRLRQGEVISLGDNFWYAVMTAHGLGAFIAWAGFFLMGISFWVLMKVGFPIRSFVLPEDVDVTAIRAESKDGVLTIHMPRVAVEKTRPVAITVQ